MPKTTPNRLIGKRSPAGVVLAAVLVLLGGAVLLFSRGQPGPGQGTLDDAAASAGGAVATPFAAVGQFFGRIGGMWTATDTVRRLEEDNARLELFRLQAEELSVRVQDLEQLLRIPRDGALHERVNFDAAVPARLVLDAGGPFTRSLLANAGRDRGVAPDFYAINGQGLVGRVVAVGSSTARVLLLDDYNSRVPVMGQTSRVRAVVVGQAGARANLLTGPAWFGDVRLDYVVDTETLRDGELLVTSGDGGVFPRGIAVGRAVKGNDGRWQVALAVASRPIDMILLVPFSAAAEPEDAPDVAPPPPPPMALITPEPPPRAPIRAAPVPPPAAADDPDTTPTDQVEGPPQ